MATSNPQASSSVPALTDDRFLVETPTGDLAMYELAQNEEFFQYAVVEPPTSTHKLAIPVEQPRVVAVKQNAAVDPKTELRCCETHEAIQSQFPLSAIDNVTPVEQIHHSSW